MAPCSAVKAYGRDASDTARIAKAWRTLWYREEGRAVSYSRLQAVEHEALVSMMAAEGGASVSKVVAAGETSSEVALFVDYGGFRSLAEEEPGDIDDEFLVGVWRDVKLLHDASISHGTLTTQNIYNDGGHHVLGNFERGSVVADTADKGQDVVGLLFSLSLLVGSDRAVKTAVEGAGRNAVEDALPYLQLPAISRDGKKQADNPKDAR